MESITRDSGRIHEKKARMAQNRPRLRHVLATLLAGGLIWLGLVCWKVGRHRRPLVEIKAEMAQAHYGIAARGLTALLTQNPNADEAAYLLGVCEQRRGHNGAAAEAWGRVAPGSEFASQAVRARMRHAQEMGRFAEAEQQINEAADDPRNDGSELRAMLIPLYSQLGRIDEAERLAEARWEHLSALGQIGAERALFQLRLHITLSIKPNSVENIRAFLDDAARRAPQDDRVWLGRANMAIRTGDFGTASVLLEKCLKRRPDDVPVWRARLSWAMGAGRDDIAREALSHLPTAALTPAEFHRALVWLAAHSSDIESERQELLSLLAIAPADLTAIDGLLRLAKKDGKPERVAELSAKKEEIERLRARYETLHDRKQPVRDAVEMARIAEQLGRNFEARAFLTVAVSEDSEREDLRRELRRLGQVRPPTSNGRQPLAGALAHEPAKNRVDRGTPPR
jgi:tetratricopeptide (TPR) repeat protein